MNQKREKKKSVLYGPDEAEETCCSISIIQVRKNGIKDAFKKYIYILILREMSNDTEDLVLWKALLPIRGALGRIFSPLPRQNLYSSKCIGCPSCLGVCRVLARTSVALLLLPLIGQIQRRRRRRRQRRRRIAKP